MNKYERALNRLAIPEGKAFLYLRTMFHMIENNKSLLNGNITTLYEKVGNRFGVSAGSVERGINYHVKNLSKSKNTLKKHIFGNRVDIKVKSFIRAVYKYINVEVKGVQLFSLLELYSGRDTDIIIYNGDVEDKNIVIGDYERYYEKVVNEFFLLDNMVHIILKKW